MAVLDVHGGIAPAQDGIEYLLWRHAHADGEVTTLITPTYAARRGSVVIDDGNVLLAERGAAPVRPLGDLEQAGPLLVVDGTIVFDTGRSGPALP